MGAREREDQSDKASGGAIAASNKEYMYGHSLLRWLNDGLDIGPGLVESWESNEDASEWVTYYKRYKDGKLEYEDSWNSEYSALYDDKGKKIPTPKVEVAEVDGSYYGFDFSAQQ